MTASVGVRAAALAGVGLVAVAVVVMVAHLTAGRSASSTGQWYSALAAPYAPTAGRTTSACGVTVGPATVGVAHPTLPCGVKIDVRFGGRDVVTRVVDRGRTVPGREFDLTLALARRLGVRGTQTIRWRFAP